MKHAKFLLVEASEDRLNDMRSRLMARLPDATVEIFSSQADALAHRQLYGGIPIDRHELTILLDVAGASADARLDEMFDTIIDLKEEFSDMRREFGDLLPIWKGSHKSPGIPYRVERLEESRKWWNSEAWKAIKWLLVTCVTVLLAWLFGKKNQ